MEQHKTLELLMRTLFANNCMKTWNIFEENSGNIVLKIRFTKTEDSKNDNFNNAIKSVSYKGSLLHKTGGTVKERCVTMLLVVVSRPGARLLQNLLRCRGTVMKFPLITPGHWTIHLC